MIMSATPGRSRSHSFTESIVPAKVKSPSSVNHNFCDGVVSGGVVTVIFKN